MHNLIGKWIPPNERSKFASGYMGSALGAAAFLPIFGFIITLTTWEAIYYICGCVGIIWFTLWQYYIFDSPAEHPHIEAEEREYIQRALGTAVQNSRASV